MAKREKFYYQYDFLLLFITIAIALFGVLMIYSTSSYTAYVKFDNPYRFVRQQLLGLVIGVAAMLLVSKIDYQVFIQGLGRLKINLIHILYWAAVIMQTIVLIPGIGIEANGARRWLKLGPVQFQPSEISKIAVIMFLAYAVYKSRRSLDSFLGFLRVAAYAGVLIVLVAAQNLSTAIIIAGITVGMCFVASKKKGYFLACGLALGGLSAAYIFLGAGFRASRITAWRDLENSGDAGMQILQGLYAIASGGIFGSGLGQSMQKLGYIPEAYNDMIFAVICEELGVVGAAMVMIAFLLLLWRIVLIACNAPDIFGSMLCIGVMIHIAVQVVLNIAVVTNTIPSTGVPLPFISYGGTASAIMMAEMGLVLGVSRQVKIK